MAPKHTTCSIEKEIMSRSGEILIRCNDVQKALEDVLLGRPQGQVVLRSDDILQMFNDLLSRNVTREEISGLAFTYTRLHDDKKLLCYTPRHQNAILDAIGNLEMADATTTDRPYLYDTEDFRAWLEEFQKRAI